jgi:uncharacterized SAM-binding protein YcdF (DUF218 family)
MKTLGADILPNLALWGVFLGVLLLGIRQGWGRGNLLLKLSALLMLILSLPVSSKIAADIWALEAQNGDMSQPPPNMAVLVFGGGLGTDEHGNVWPSGNSLMRGFEGSRLAARLSAPLMITGGAPHGKGVSEAETIAEFLNSKGFPDRIYIEKNSVNTWDNAVNSYAIFQQKGWAGVYAVTDMVHSRRAVASLRAAGFPRVHFWPAGVKPATGVGAADFLPTVSGLSRWRIMSYEISAVAYYVVVGRIGFADIF